MYKYSFFIIFFLSFYSLGLYKNNSNYKSSKSILVKTNVKSNFDKLSFQATGSLCDCSKRKTIVINSTTAETDFQVMLDIDFATGMQTDFSDIRFTSDDGTTEISFWIEEYTASDDATVWVKVPNLAIGANRIYLYYDGCSSTNASNASNTFIFYDDMSSLTGWNDYGTGDVFATTTLGATTITKDNNCDPNGGWKSIGATISNFKLITREIRTTAGNNNSCSLNRYGVENSGFNGYNINRQANGGNRPFGLEARTNGGGNNANRPNRNQPIDTWFRTELTRCSTTNQVTAQLYADNRNPIGGLVTSTMPNNRNYTNFDRVTIRGGHDFHVDFMAVAKNSCGTITTTIGSEVSEADLSLIKTVNNAIPKVGDNIIYTITITNNGPLCATGVEVEDVLPNGLVFVSAIAPTGTTYNNTSHIWDFNTESIEPNSSLSLTITATVSNSGIIVNNAKIIKSDQADPDSDPTN